MENEKKNTGRKIAVCVAAVALVAAICLAVYFLFIKNKPLNEAAVGKWEAVKDCSTLVGNSQRSIFLSLDIDVSEAQNVPTEARQYLFLTEDGRFVITADTDDLVDLLNKAVDGVIDYYAAHPTEFIEKIGLGEEYEGDGSDLSGEKIREYMSAKLIPVREKLSGFTENYFLDDDGDVIIAEGTYTVTDDRIDFDVIPERTLAGLYADVNYIVASASSKAMTVKECSFYALDLEAQTELTKID